MASGWISANGWLARRPDREASLYLAFEIDKLSIGTVTADAITGDAIAAQQYLRALEQ
ncbi:MAG: hypothetical protein U5O39_05680 [Gammaproteobacteria bacterium]|nr:hypothetical protein [Gammaproteobacteria bacterium]